MKRSRRNHSLTFKANVAMQAIRGDKTLIADWLRRWNLWRRETDGMVAWICQATGEARVHRAGPKVSPA